VRPISVSTDVFAQIWALRRPCEDSEDMILRRVLGCPTREASPSRKPSTTPIDHEGVFDARHSVSFKDGFEVFRTYLGSNYKARVANGGWLLVNNNRIYRSLNDLSSAIGAKTENAWANWYYKDERGESKVVSNLRDPSTIAKRKHKLEADVSHTNSNEAKYSAESNGTWRDDVRVSLERLNGPASLHSIYAEVRALRRRLGRSIPPAFEAVVRKTLEEHSTDSDAYRGGPDLFLMPEGKGAGIWALR